MNLIVYTNRCLTCRYKNKLESLVAYARQHGRQVITRRTTLSPLAAEEAHARSELRLPFIYSESNGRSVGFLSSQEEDWATLI